MDIQNYIKPELLILIPVLYLIGTGLKQSNIKDKYIPCLLSCISILLCAIWVLANSTIASGADIATAVFTSITQGVLIVGASVYCNQLIKQLRKED